MAFPSFAEIIGAINEALTIFAEGGIKAIALIFIIVLVVGGFSVWLFIKFLLKFLKEHNDDKEQALGVKDNLLNESRLRLENINDQYAKLLTQSIEREQMLTNEVRELKGLVTIFLTGNNKVKNYDRDDDDHDDARRRPKRKN